jgi:ABC-type antimicrobial peptide transport system permease subunit
VSRRRLEIGIRVALGADPRSVVRMVLREVGRLLAAGVLLGAGLAVLGARSARSLLYGLDPWDPVSLAAGAVALGAVALLAGWIPARRASRLAPTVALRES